MVKFYDNRELSKKLGINLSRWKRWSREFLPPDPLAGQQAGYARQYYVDNAFTVFVGGHLVSELGFSIPDARWILTESREWMKSNGFQLDPRGNPSACKGIAAHIEDYAIHIRVSSTGRLTIYARGVIGRRDAEYEGYKVKQEIYVEQSIAPANGTGPRKGGQASEKVLLISELLEQFCKALDPEGVYFKGLPG